MDRDVTWQIVEHGLDVRTKPIQYKITEDGCWECISHRRRRGYALVARNGREHGVHRYVYELHHGKVPSTLVILHRCDNPSCINPDHLKTGTQKENMQDKMAKGRGYIPRSGGNVGVFVHCDDGRPVDGSYW